MGNKENAMQGAKALATKLQLTPEKFCQKVLKVISQKIEDSILDYILKIETGKTMSGFFPHYRKSEMLDLHFTTQLPIIGIGAAAQHLLPQIAARLGTKVIFPDHYEVGNALGGVLMAIGNK